MLVRWLTFREWLTLWAYLKTLPKMNINLPRIGEDIKPTEPYRERVEETRATSTKLKKMYTRSNSMTLSIETNHQESHFAYSRAMAARSKEPEIFTFERIPAQDSTLRTYAPIRPKRRCVRVMYPANVRKYLPPAEKSPAKRWLLALCLVVLWQIYTEEPCVDTPLGRTDSPASEYQVLPFQSAEEQARQLTDAGASSKAPTAISPTCEDKLSRGESSSWAQILLNTTCPSPSLESEISRMYEQSTRNGYVVALLVYHRLGSDN